jgi:hypothetical protein
MHHFFAFAFAFVEANGKCVLKSHLSEYQNILCMLLSQVILKNKTLNPKPKEIRCFSLCAGNDIWSYSWVSGCGI